MYLQKCSVYSTSLVEVLMQVVIHQAAYSSSIHLLSFPLNQKNYYEAQFHRTFVVIHHYSIPLLSFLEQRRLYFIAKFRQEVTIHY